MLILDCQYHGTTKRFPIALVNSSAAAAINTVNWLLRSLIAKEFIFHQAVLHCSDVRDSGRAKDKLLLETQQRGYAYLKKS